jgi:plasmid stabilization system protein ParE
VKLNIVKHRKAKRDALQIFVFIGEDNLDSAQRFLRALNEDLKKLAEMPGMGAIRTFQNPKLDGVRSWPVSGFRNDLIFYRATSTELQFLRVIHGARDIERAPGD